MAKKAKCSPRKGLLNWEGDLRDNYESVFDDSLEKAVLAVCQLCKKHSEKIKKLYKGKIVAHIVTWTRRYVAPPQAKPATAYG